MQRTFRRRPAGAVAALAVLLAIPMALRADVRNDDLFARLSVHMTTATMPDEQARKIILDALAERDADTDDLDLLIEVLVLMSPELRAGLDAYDEEDYAGCLEAMDGLGEVPDPFVRYHARAYAIKSLVHLGRLVEAQERITKLLDDVQMVAMYSLEETELTYLLGYCQVQNLEHVAAQATLERFLRDFPDASPRFVVTARQMLAELARRIPEGIGEVADLMQFSKQRLAAADAGERTREAQSRTVELLDKLIQQVEEQESQAKSSSSQSNRNRPRQSQPQQPPEPNQPMPESRTTPGMAQEGSKMAGRQVSPGDAWGAMPPAEREKILQVLKDRFPGRYRALVEQYYQTLAEQP